MKRRLILSTAVTSVGSVLGGCLGAFERSDQSPETSETMDAFEIYITNRTTEPVTLAVDVVADSEQIVSSKFTVKSETTDVVGEIPAETREITVEAGVNEGIQHTMETFDLTEQPAPIAAVEVQLQSKRTLTVNLLYYDQPQ